MLFMLCLSSLLLRAGIACYFISFIFQKESTIQTQINRFYSYTNVFYIRYSITLAMNQSLNLKKGFILHWMQEVFKSYFFFQVKNTE